MKITLLHPSRGRAKKAFDTFNYWMDKCANRGNVGHILSIDADDPQRKEYYERFNGHSSYIICQNNADVVQATNVAAKLSSGDILVYLSDDFKCPDNWDELIINKFIEHNFLTESTPGLLKVDDCLQKFHIAVLTIPIMNRALYKKLGYFWHPGYKSMFVDEDLYWTSHNNGWMILCEDLKFPHEHVCNRKAENDETYIRSAANWEQGKAFFAQRKALNFPL